MLQSALVLIGVLETQMTAEPAELERYRRILRDCQDSLALALARLEAYRCRERVLTRENQALRAALLHAGVRIDQVVRPQQEAAEDIGGPHVRAAVAEPDNGSGQMPDTAALDTLYILPMSGGHPIYFNTSKERVRRLAALCLTLCCVCTTRCMGLWEMKATMLHLAFAGSRQPACARGGFRFC